MTIVTLEKWTSGRIEVSNAPYAEFEYLVSGTDNAIAAASAFLSTIPEVSDGTLLQSAGITGRLSEFVWTATARYGAGRNNEREEKKSPGDDVTYNFDASAGNAHITNSFETVGSYAPPGKVAPDFQGAINVTADSVEGVDVYVPQFQFEVTGWFSPAQVNFAYIATLFRQTATTNNATFKEFAAGELLFLGAQGTRKNAELWEIKFKFAASPNQENLTVGDVTGISKKGWEYLWIRYEDIHETEVRKILKRPAFVYVERVYEASDYSKFGLGV